ncbi:hypothetical protein MWH28_09435 [Natroniella sulfidigena]|uniref:TetR/AcrR family transcriptional regulator n=1 Tax=Natroniella sulfidigena TaxID=723921 RepID=UPI00200A41F4|nr:TetR/AcrR family transcriptional regulator [Natroniella sulfidigena]MCK8817578.1 hypothetical protein [Natroniella sulfidigena]
MSPKRKFSKQQIIDSAIEVVKIEGIEGLTARKVANELGSSVAPIYVNFEDIEELKRTVVHKILELNHQMSMEEGTGDRFLDMGIASLRFAKEYSLLFRDLVLKKNNYMEDYEEKLGNDIIREMSSAPELEKFNEEELEMILLKMRVFQLGLSVMIANDLLPEDFGEEKHVELLASMGTDVITATRLQKQEID